MTSPPARAGRSPGTAVRTFPRRFARRQKGGHDPEQRRLDGFVRRRHRRSNLRRLTKSPEDESSPCWSPDSQWICFAARNQERGRSAKYPSRAGLPQRIPPRESQSDRAGLVAGWEVDRLHRPNGRVRDLRGAVARRQRDGIGPGRRPSWAPNSRTLVMARRNGGVLSLLDVPTKQVKDVTRVSSGVNSQPSWAR